jgi:hypothetical protein
MNWTCSGLHIDGRVSNEIIWLAKVIYFDKLTFVSWLSYKVFFLNLSLHEVYDEKLRTQSTAMLFIRCYNNIKRTGNYMYHPN